MTNELTVRVFPLQNFCTLLIRLEDQVLKVYTLQVHSTCLQKFSGIHRYVGKGFSIIPPLNCSGAFLFVKFKFYFNGNVLDSLEISSRVGCEVGKIIVLCMTTRVLWLLYVHMYNMF